MIVTVVELLISILSISSYSLWTDEGIRLHAIVFGNLKEVIHYGLADKQLFFVLKQYFWTSLFGISEIATRSLNLVFVCLIIYYLNLILEKKGIDTSYGIVLFISPMFVYYMNDAGPYIILLAYSLAFLYYVFYTDQFNSKKNVLMINLIFLLGIGTHFIFGFVYLIYLVKVIYVTYQKNLKFKTHFLIGLAFSPVYLTLLAFYLQAIESGVSRGWEPPTIMNGLFILYSFMGMSGLSLSRNEIRAGHFETIQWHQIVLPGLLLLLMLGVFLLAVKYKKQIIKPNRLLLIGTFVYCLVFYLFSYKWHFHFWERHFIMAYAVFILLLIEVFSQLSKQKSIKILFSLICLLFFISSLQLRLNPYYGKDNYKDAIDYVLSSPKRIVLYQGDWKVSNYYGIDALSFKDYQNKNGNNQLYNVIDIRNKTAKEVQTIIGKYSEEDILIVFNEKYDEHQVLKVFMKDESYEKQTYNTFTIFERR